MKMEQHKPSLMSRMKSLISEYGRVLRITKKPTNEEFKGIVKISGIGMGIIGLIGFIIQMIKILLFE